MRCKQCLTEKDASAFYVSNRTRCKECIKAAVRANYQENREHFRAYEKARASQPHRVAARREYQATLNGRLRHAAANQRWMNAHPERKRATTQVNNAITRGKLRRLPCLVCGEQPAEGHHPDYSRPLDVMWLCNEHHRAAHAASEELEAA